MRRVLGSATASVGSTFGTLRNPRRIRDSIRIEDAVGDLFGRTLSRSPGRPSELRCRCIDPNHEDRHPSLRIDTNKQVFYCDVCQSGGDVFTVVQIARGCSYADAGRWLATAPPFLPASILERVPTRGRLSRKGAGRLACGSKRVVYPYFDEHWQMRYEKIRTPDKDFFYRRPLGDGRWDWGLAETPRLLYLLPALKGFPFVFVVEGEKDVHAAWDHDLPATTNPEGAGNGKWTNAYARQLKATGVQRVYVIPDNDDVGKAHAEQVVARCRRVGLKAWLVPLPGLAEHGDLSDYFALGHSRSDVLRLCKRARS